MSGNQITYSQAVKEMCDKQLQVNKILLQEENGEIGKEEAYDLITALVYDDWYLQQIKDRS
ncbi:hypothetical protein D3C80_1379100 [compost metagenome]